MRGILITLTLVGLRDSMFIATPNREQACLGKDMVAPLIIKVQRQQYFKSDLR